MMNELRRFRIELGKRTTFDEHTIVDHPLDPILDDLLWEETEEGSDIWIVKQPEIITVTPNQKINIYGIILTVPQDASEMVKWSSDSIKSALVYFTKSTNELVDNAFAYRICMDNWIELSEPTGNLEVN